MNKESTRQWELLLIGSKDAVYFAKDRLTSEDINTLLNSGKEYIELESNYIFFKNCEQKQKFLEKGGLDKNSSLGLNETILGQFLNFPPNSIASYLKGIPQKKRVLIDFQGIVFISHIDSFREDLQWMKENIFIPNEYQTNISIEIYVKGKSFVFVRSYQMDESISLTKKDLKNIQKKHSKL